MPSTIIGALIGAFGGNTQTKTSTTTPTFNPAQTSLQTSLASTLEGDLQNGVNTTPMMTAGTDAINKSYAGADAQITQADAARGFGESGAVGSGAQQVALARAGAVGGLQANLDQYALQQDQNILGDAENFSFADPGSTGTTVTQNGSTLSNTLAGAYGGFSDMLNSLSGSAGSGSSDSSSLGSDVPGLGSSIWANGTGPTPGTGGSVGLNTGG